MCRITAIKRLSNLNEKMVLIKYSWISNAVKPYINYVCYSAILLPGKCDVSDFLPFLNLLGHVVIFKKLYYLFAKPTCKPTWIFGTFAFSAQVVDSKIRNRGHEFKHKQQIRKSPTLFFGNIIEKVHFPFSLSLAPISCLSDLNTEIFEIAN